MGVGRAEAAVDNTSGAAAAVSVTWQAGIFRLRNSSAGDAITIADIGTRCFIVDDDTGGKDEWHFDPLARRAGRGRGQRGCLGALRRSPDAGGLMTRHPASKLQSACLTMWN